MNYLRYINDSLKVQCDDYDGNAHQKRDCSALLKVEKNDKIKFTLSGRSYDWTSVTQTAIEGFLVADLT